MKFEEKFSKYVSPEDSISVTVDGITYTATVKHDDVADINDDDTHSEDQSVTGCNDKQHLQLMEARQAWYKDQWFYCGIVISATIGGMKMPEDGASLRGIEANYPGQEDCNAYLNEVANELLSEAVESAGVAIKTLRELLQNVQEPPQEGNKIETQFGSVDVELFKRQKQAFYTVIQGGLLRDDITGLLGGLLGMLDILQDEVLEPLSDETTN